MNRGNPAAPGQPGESSLPLRPGHAPMDSSETRLLANLDRAIRRAYASPLDDAVPAGPETALPDATAEETLPGRIGRYRVLGLLARGGMGTVVRAEDPDLGREVAVKISRSRDPELLARFENEARIGSRLAHPGIVPIHEVIATEDGRPCFVMKLVAGETLAALLAARPGPAAGLARMTEVFRGVCQTMAFVHSRGIFHGDLKPANVMVGEFGEVQVMDWGFAGAAPEGSDAGGGSGAHPGPARAMGTPAYMAPEQARADHRRIGIRSDVFSLGAILCEILTGAPPYSGRSRSEALLDASRGWLDDARARIAAAPADPVLVGLALACLAPEPEDRPTDAGAVTAVLSEHARAAADRARSAELELARAHERQRAERRARRLSVALALAVVLGVVAGGVGFVLFVEERRGREIESARVAGEELAEAHRLVAEARSLEPPSVEAWTKAEEAAAQVVTRIARSPAPGTALRRARDLLAETRRLRTERERQLALQEALEEIEHHGLEEERPEPWLDAAYRQAFRDSGIDPTHPAGSLPESVRERQALGIALGRWALVRRRTSPKDSRAADLILRAAIDVDPDPARKTLMAAFLAGDGDALQAAARTFEDSGAPAESMILLSRLFAALGCAEDAIRVLRSACRRHPSDFQAHHDLAVRLQYERPAPEAEIIRLLSMCVALRPGSAHALTDLASAWRAGGDLGRAVETLRLATAIPACRPRAWMTLASVLHLAGEPEAAEDAAREAVRRDEDADALVRGGAQFRRLGFAKTAGEAFRKAAALDPGHAPAHGELGRLELERGTFDAGVRSLERAAELAPREASAWRALGRALLDSDRWREAAAALRRCLDLDPRSASDWTALGRALFREDHAAEAVAAFERAAAIEEGNAARAEEALRRLADARDAALPGNPGGSPAAEASAPGAGDPARAGRSSALRGRLVTAAAQFDAAVSAGPAADMSGLRYDAARTASLAGRGIGKEAAAAAPETRARWRARARAWLAAELDALRAQEAALASEGPRLRRRLAEWKADPALVSDRHPASFAELAPEERAAWSTLWDEVDRLLAGPEAPATADGVAHEREFRASALGIVGPLAALEFDDGGRTLLVAGNAGFEAAAIHALPVVRDPATRAITGFGPPARRAAAPHADGGLAFGPGGTLFWTTWTGHELGQLASGGRVRRFPLDATGVPEGGGGLAFVPRGPGAGDLLVSSYTDGSIFRVELEAGLDGLFPPAPGSAQLVVRLPRGSEGIRVVPSGPFAGDLLVCNWDAGTVSVVGLAGDGGQEAHGARRALVHGLPGAAGLAIDPVSGALLVSTWGSGNRIHVFSGLLGG